MKAELFNRLQNANVQECTRILVRDNFNNPVCLIIKQLESTQGQECITISKVGDKDFHSFLQQNGIHDTVVCEKMDVGKPSNLIV